MFGHTHYTTEFRENGVRVVSNQRGYVLPWTRTDEKVKNGFDAGRVIQVWAPYQPGSTGGVTGLRQQTRLCNLVAFMFFMGFLSSWSNRIPQEWRLNSEGNFECFELVTVFSFLWLLDGTAAGRKTREWGMSSVVLFVYRLHLTCFILNKRVTLDSGVLSPWQWNRGIDIRMRLWDSTFYKYDMQRLKRNYDCRLVTARA
jgi:hypothetical protein